MGNLSFADRVVLQATDPVNVSLYSNGQSVSIGTQTAITGILDAPLASIAVGSRARFNGCARRPPAHAGPGRADRELEPGRDVAVAEHVRRAARGTSVARADVRDRKTRASLRARGRGRRVKNT